MSDHGGAVMDINWYTHETMVRETLQARRAKAETTRLAATARRHRTRRWIGTVLIRLGSALVAETGASIAEEAPRCA